MQDKDEKTAQGGSMTRQQAEQEMEQLRKVFPSVRMLTAEQVQAGEAVGDAARQALESARTEAEQLAAELERLRPEAEAYAQFRDRVGDIECDAHKRAAELEASTLAKLRRTVDLFRAQYTALMSAFETTAAQVTVELRKVEVNLSQLPRAMDQAGTELNELAALLEQRADPEKRKCGRP